MSMDIAKLFDEIDDGEDSLSMAIRELFSDENIPLKTEIPNPKALTGLQCISRLLTNSGHDDLGDMLSDYIDDYRINMVSYNRKSRSEVVTALSEVVKARSRRLWSWRNEE